jgi:hypothetical protein
MGARPPSYLLPYARAHRRRARGAKSLLWVERHDQTVRFDALVRYCPMAGRRVLDVGSGPADLLAFLHKRGLRPAHYIGLEAQRWLVDAARRRRFDHCTIVQADFVRQPEALDVGADVVVFSGSLNLLPSRPFYRSLARAWAVTRRWLAFNFLSSPELTADRWLHWHRPAAVIAFARVLPGVAALSTIDGYESGDCTVVMRKTRRPRRRKQERPAPVSLR